MVANIWIAASDGDFDTVERYISSGTYTANAKDPNGYTPIHAAASYGHLDLLRFLLANGGDINITDNDGDTPLHTVENIDVARALIDEFGADPTLKNSDGQTARSKIEEEGEFSNIAFYLASLENNNDEQTDPSEIPNMQYSFQEIDSNTAPSAETRQQLQDIIESDNATSRMEEFLRSSLQNSLNGQTDDSSRKVRRKADS